MLIVSLVVIQVFLFVGLIFILRRILTKNVTLATKHLDELNQDYIKKEEHLTKQLEEVKSQSQEIIQKAQEEAEKIRSQIVKESEIEKDKILKQAHAQKEELMQQADKSRQQLLSEIDDRIKKEAVNKACELMQDVLPEQFKKIVHEHWAQDLIESGFGQLDRLRVPEDTREIKIVTAFGLSDDERKKISKKLKDSLGRDIALKEEIDPKVVAGFIITIGSLVLDGSLKNKIQENARSV